MSGEADDGSIGRGDIEVAGIDGGNRAGPAVSMLGWEFGDGRLPEKFAVFGRKGADALPFDFVVIVPAGVYDALSN